MDVGPDDNSVDNDSDSRDDDDESVDEDEDDDVRSNSDDDENDDDDDDDDDTLERLFEALAASNWGRALREGLNRRAPLAEIRALVRRRRRIPGPFRTHTVAVVGAWVLREVLRRSHRREEEEVGRGRRVIRARGAPLFYPTLPMIKFLVEEGDWGPSILHEKDENGYLALHWALIEHCPPPIVKYLVKMAPQAVRVEIEATGKEKGVIFPIHLALDRTDGGLVDRDPFDEQPIVDDFDVAPWETIQCLLDAWPESIQQPSHRGWIPLHHALRHLRRNRNNDRRVVRGLIDRWPESISWPTQDEFRMLAFHVAVSESVPLPDLHYLLHLQPQAIHTRTRTRRCSGASRDAYLPLHLAFVNPEGEERPAAISPLSTIRFLVEAYPTALRVWTHNDHLPLHLAFGSDVNDYHERAPSLDVVQCLVESYPEALREASSPSMCGWIALFYAVDNPYVSPDVIRYLVQQYPESVQVPEQDDGCRLALHIAVGADLSVAGIDALIRAGPEALQVRTTDGYLPIHLMFRGGRGRSRQVRQQNPRHGSVLDVIKCLVAHRPSSLGERTGRQGEIPLHLALLQSLGRWSGTTEDEEAIIEYLLEQSPESVRIATRDRGWLALHCAAHKGRSDRVLRSLLNLWPNSVRQVTRDDDHQLLAIHLAATMLSTPLPSLQVLLDAWPDSVWERSGEGLLPIHYAAKKDGTPEFIRCFLESCSGDAAADLIAARSRDGFLPIHLAAARPCCYVYFSDTERLQRRRKLEMIRFLVDHGPPDGLLLSGATPDGSLPLHLALRSAALDMDVVKYLVKRCPESVRHRDYNGSLALHVLVAEVQGDGRPTNREVWWNSEPHRLRLQCLLGAAKLLVRSHPEALLVKDCGGRLPFHLAAEGDHASLDVLYLLLRRRPEAIQRGERQERRGEKVRGRPRRRPAMAASSRGRRSSSTSAAASSKRRRSDARAVA